MTVFNDPRGDTPWSRDPNEQELELEEETKAKMSAMRAWLFYPVPGVLLLLWLVQGSTEWPVITWLIWAVLLHWVGAGIFHNWNHPWVVAARRAIVGLFPFLRRTQEDVAEEEEKPPPAQVKWPGPAHDDTHLAYRQQWEALARKGLDRTDDDHLAMAQASQGLKNYGDDPTAVALGEVGLFPTMQVKAPSPKNAPDGAFAWRGLIDAGAVAQTAGAGWASLLMRYWWVAAIPILLGWVGLERGGKEAALRARDAGCSDNELKGETTRESCIELGRAALALKNRDQEIVQLNNQVRDTADQALAAEDRRQRLQRQLASARADAATREREANARALEAARSGAAPDWDASLRDLQDPVAAAGEPAEPAPTADPDPGRGVPIGGAGTAALQPSDLDSFGPADAG